MYRTETIMKINAIVAAFAALENKYNFTFHYTDQGEIFLEFFDTGDEVQMSSLIGD